MKLLDLLWGEYVPSRLNLSHKSAQQIEFAINSLSSFLGRPAVLEDLTEANINRWVRARIEERSRETVRRQRSRLLTLWRFAARRKLRERPPEFEPIRCPKKVPRAWTLQEFEMILRACSRLSGRMDGSAIRQADWWTSLHLFLYDSGARLNAALSIRSSELALFQRCCLLRADAAKTLMEQVVRFSAQTAEAISRIYDCERELVWPYAHCRRYLFVEYKRILATAGVDYGRYVGFHRLRKTHATQAVLAAGWEHASRDLGHTSVRMTQEYVDLRQIEFGQVQLPRPAFM